MSVGGRRTGPGELAFVLHTHMPYVEGGGAWPPENPEAHLRSPDGFGTWPFGEEWLWEAIATSYLPLLEVLGRAPITLSLTPVLCDQLEAPGARERCLRFFEEIRPESHDRDLRGVKEAGYDELVVPLERSKAQYAAAAAQLRELSDGLLTALGGHATWTSAASHAVLPMLASDTLISVQVQSGVASHRRRFGSWDGGFWLPECAHGSWLNQPLEEAGVRSTCVELSGLYGPGDARHLRPLRTEEGPVLWPIDRQTISLVWADRGYPSGAAYRSSHALTAHHHRIWANDGTPYEPDRALALAREHARDFVARVGERVRDGGVCVCALDTELLGHWWHEGVQWLAAVVGEAAARELRLTTLDDALTRIDPQPAPAELGVSSWGEGRDLRTWSAPAVADLAWTARRAELRALATAEKPSDRALRELLALQSSDWAFLATRGLAGDYPRERSGSHARALEAALSDTSLGSALRNLAPDLRGWS